MPSDGNLKYFTIRAPGAERFTRLDKRYGDAYSLDGIVRRISGQPGLVRLDHRPPPRKVRFRGALPRSRLRGMYLYYCYVIGIFPQKKAYVPTDPAALKKVRMLSPDPAAAQQANRYAGPAYGLPGRSAAED